MKFILGFKRGFLGFPHLVQGKWKTLETTENRMVKTFEHPASDVEISPRFRVRTHVRKRNAALAALPILEKHRDSDYFSLTC